MQPSKHKSCKMYVSVDAQNSWGVGRCTRLALQTAWGARNGLPCRPICSFSRCLWLTIDRSQDDMLVKCRERAPSCLVFAGPFQSMRLSLLCQGQPRSAPGSAGAPSIVDRTFGLVSTVYSLGE